MNTLMWSHPITSEHIGKIKGWGYEIIDPVSKTLMCGDVGVGAMAEVTTIIEATKGLPDSPLRLTCHSRLRKSTG